MADFAAYKRKEKANPVHVGQRASQRWVVDVFYRCAAPFIEIFTIIKRLTERSPPRCSSRRIGLLLIGPGSDTEIKPSAPAEEVSRSANACRY